GCDQPQAAGPAVPDLVAADGKRRDGALHCRLADRAGLGNALAEADDPREGVDDAEPVAGGTGDQQPAIVGAEVERRIDGGVHRCRSQPGRAPARLMAIAKPRMIVHQMSFRGPPAVMELPFAETLAAPISGAIHHNDHALSCVVVGGRVRYWVENPWEPRKNPAFQVIFNARSAFEVVHRERYRTAKIRRRPARAAQGRRHTGAR